MGHELAPWSQKAAAWTPQSPAPPRVVSGSSL